MAAEAGRVEAEDSGQVPLLAASLPEVTLAAFAGHVQTEIARARDQVAWRRAEVHLESVGTCRSFFTIAVLTYWSLRLCMMAYVLLSWELIVEGIFTKPVIPQYSDIWLYKSSWLVSRRSSGNLDAAVVWV